MSAKRSGTSTKDHIAISQAGHFLSQASMGGTPETISALANDMKARGVPEVPTGLHVEVTNALLGKNKGSIAFLPSDTVRINENGELIDEFGTPYWFHALSSSRLVIVSAGPDQILHTEDDISSADEERAR